MTFHGTYAAIFVGGAIAGSGCSGDETHDLLLDWASIADLVTCEKVALGLACAHELIAGHAATLELLASLEAAAQEQEAQSQMGKKGKLT